MARRMEKRVEFDATPEQVWEAVATGPGITAWFVPHRVEPRDGGAMEMDFGSGYETTGRITVWEAGRRFAYVSSEPPADGRPDYAYEFLVEGRDGGGTVLRFVQSGFLDSDGWDDEYSSFDAGWDLFLGNLRSYLTHFPGRVAQDVVTMGHTPGTAEQAWSVMHRGLGLDGHPAVGSTVTLTPDGPPPITGVVDVASAEFLGVRSAAGLHRFGAEGASGCGVSAYHYFYDDRPGGAADIAVLTAQWQEWLTRLFPAPA